MWTKGGGKEAYPPAGTSLQGFAHRTNYSCKSSPVRECLQTFSSDLFAAQRDGLCGQLHVACPGRYSCGSVSAVFTCGEKAYIAKQKKRRG